ncbi:MAG: hypothetical protein Q7K71_07495 [Candidatus Omnitrophota bacterium]|nr:hypothetical protein [Candidatus Omnitrophota bacterium]
MEIKSMFRKSLNIVLIVTFFASSLMPIPKANAAPLSLPEPGTMVNLSPAFEPVLIKGIKVHPENPFQFDFIVDTGHSGLSVETQHAASLHNESMKLIKYFLASLTIPEKDLWVNLSPYEKDRMIADNLGTTQMGQDMLAQDYILKQLTASLIYPERDLGKAFWDKVYQKAQQLYGTTEIPVNTFNKVWIVADKADVFERGNVAYIVGAHLKVMLEEDYTALAKHQTPTRGHVAPPRRGNVSPSMLPSKQTPEGESTPGQPAHALASQIVKDIILPSIEQEVNQGQNFAPLRQMFYSMILASWYKMALKDTILTQIYGNQSKLKGLEGQRSKVEEIYEQYLKAYKKGVFNYIKEDASTPSQTLGRSAQASTPRKYFSGGFDMAMLGSRVLNRSTVPPVNGISAVGDLAMVSGVGVLGQDDEQHINEITRITNKFAGVGTQADTRGELEGLLRDLSKIPQLSGPWGVLQARLLRDIQIRLGSSGVAKQADGAMTAADEEARKEMEIVRVRGELTNILFQLNGQPPLSPVIARTRLTGLQQRLTAITGLDPDSERSRVQLLIQINGHIASLNEQITKDQQAATREGDEAMTANKVDAAQLSSRATNYLHSLQSGDLFWHQNLANRIKALKILDDLDSNGHYWGAITDLRSNLRPFHFSEEAFQPFERSLQSALTYVNRVEADPRKSFNRYGYFPPLIEKALILSRILDFLPGKKTANVDLTGINVTVLSHTEALVGVDSAIPKAVEELRAMMRQHASKTDGTFIKNKIFEVAFLNEGWKNLETLLKKFTVLVREGWGNPESFKKNEKAVKDLLGDAAMTASRMQTPDEAMNAVDFDDTDKQIIPRIISIYYTHYGETSRVIDGLSTTLPAVTGQGLSMEAVEPEAIRALKSKFIFTKGFDDSRKQYVISEQAIDEILAAFRKDGLFGLYLEFDNRMAYYFIGGLPIPILIKLSQPVKKNPDAAMATTPGGIDLNRARMQMNVRKEGQGVQMQFDPAMIERIKRDGFDGLEFQINTIIPITNLPLLLGLREDEQQGHPQLAGV